MMTWIEADRLVWPHYLRIEPEDDYGWRLIAVFKPRQGQDGKTLA
ncbi:hypothetical protein [Bifidobacterium choerinum]|uniref:Uncharacterized protein n=1 Tax=Bifidobacterium choerinum TaxID=35760 RepID=A0A087AFB3_9BIFI|nr:hypothetical protein [Bifidobacterium choerinum]KFI57463.1 hypothetical protein BCHO_0882 [Bifidobacterium choerinum]